MTFSTDRVLGRCDIARDERGKVLSRRKRKLRAPSREVSHLTTSLKTTCVRSRHLKPLKGNPSTSSFSGASSRPLRHASQAQTAWAKLTLVARGQLSLTTEQREGTATCGGGAVRDRGRGRGQESGGGGPRSSRKSTMTS
jgi:hypothetical protein